MSLWICLSVPFDIAFQPSVFLDPGQSSLNQLIDAAYIIDIAFNFRTTITDFLTGDEIHEGRIIARQYLRSTFIIDLLAAIPYDIIISRI
jgi:hypothetical protein